MTIHSDWGKLLHEECPDAFTDDLPSGQWDVGVIDGHLQLMCLNSNFISWDRFIQVMYLAPIYKLFKLGCPTVVLCFDNYEKVPAYKNMTQLKRSQGKKVAVFHPKQLLPPIIPEDAMLFLMNRDFKVKLVHTICNKLPSMITMERHQSLIIDYKSVVLYSPLLENEKCIGCLPPKTLSQYKPMGESDVKFVRYAESMGNALIHAIDGDYMIIALLYYCTHGMRQNNKIFILRQQSILQNHSKAKVELSHSDKKRKRSILGAALHEQVCSVDDFFQQEASKSKASKPSATDAKQKGGKKIKWWVNMQMLFEHLIAIGSEVSEEWSHQIYAGASTFPPSEAASAFFSKIVETQIFLILMAGTDFSRSFPMIGPKRIWDFWPQIVKNHRLFLDETCADEEYILDVIVNSMYNVLFAKHIPSYILQNHDWEVTYAYIQSCGTISETSKKRIPAKEQILCTIRNIRWLIKYWKTINGSISTPLDGSNGFSSSVTEQGKVVFSDQILACC